MASNQPTLVITNPLHYAYLPQRANAPAMGSSHGLIADYASELGFGSKLRMYDTANTIEALIQADLDANHTDASYIAWKPVDTTEVLLGNSFKVARPLECKAHIRTIIPTDLFPEFTVIAANNSAAMSYSQLSTELQSQKLVFQIDYSIGGRGTFFVEDEQTFQAVLPDLIASKQDTVVSRRINGTSRGIQCFMAAGTAYNTPWWHKDLVGLEAIYAKSVPGVTHYCGAVLENIPDQHLSQVKALLRTVGERLTRIGYYGIFGMDIVVDEANGKVYLIEINPRVTAVSHVYATVMRAVGCENDFLSAYADGLLEPESINRIGKTLQVSAQLPNPYCYLKLQNIGETSVVLNETCRLGVYDELWQYKRFGFGIDVLKDSKEIVVIPESARTAIKHPGERVFSLIGVGDPIQDGRLTHEWQQRIAESREHFLSAA